MAIISVQGTNLRCSLLFLHIPPINLIPQMRIKSTACFKNFAQSTTPANLTIKLSSMVIKSKGLRSQPSENQKNGTKTFQGIVDRVMKVLKALQKPATVLILLGLVMNFDPQSTLAASGGRMGGRSFSSRSSFSSSPSRSYSTRTTNPSIPYSVPFYAPSPFGFGGGMGSNGLLVASLLGFTFALGLVIDRSGRGSVLTDTEKTSVLKLQVGMLGMGRSLQRDLNRIAETADTSTKQGLSYVLTESTLALLRHPDYCISGYSSVDVRQGVEEGEKCFNKLSIEERGKFDEETLVNVNNIVKKRPSTQPSTAFSNEYIVITILVAAEGVHKLPSVNSSGDLDNALQMLGSIPSSGLLAVEVLWTPQNESETLSERELLEDYPILRPL